MTRFSPGFLGRGGTTTWNPADKTSGVILSNLNLTAGFINTTQIEAVRSISSNASGKAYFELTPTASGFGGAGSTAIGFASAAHLLKDVLGNDAYSIGWFSNGSIIVGGTSYGIDTGEWFGGLALGIAVDFGAKRVWFFHPGSDWNANSGDPAANIGGISCPITGAMFAIAMNISGDTIDANFGGAPFQFQVPAGFGPGLT